MAAAIRAPSRVEGVQLRRHCGQLRVFRQLRVSVRDSGPEPLQKLGSTPSEPNQKLGCLRLACAFLDQVDPAGPGLRFRAVKQPQEGRSVAGGGPAGQLVEVPAHSQQVGEPQSGEPVADVSPGAQFVQVVAGGQQVSQLRGGEPVASVGGATV
jgi:hypothetical protein